MSVVAVMLFINLLFGVFDIRPAVPGKVNEDKVLARSSIKIYPNSF